MSIDELARRAADELRRDAAAQPIPELPGPRRRLARNVTTAFVAAAAVAAVIVTAVLLVPGPTTSTLPPATSPDGATTIAPATTGPPQTTTPDTAAPDNTPPQTVTTIPVAANGWSRLPVSTGVSRPAGDSQMLAVAAAPDGTVAAVGQSTDGRAVFWYSPDGTTWQVADVMEADSQAADIIWLDDRFVAVGRTGADAAFWESSDGETWSLAAAVPAAADEGFAAARSISAGAIGVYAGGHESYPGGIGVEEADFDAAVWQLDGDGEWRRIEHPGLDAPGYDVDGYAAIGGIAVGPNGIVAAGTLSEESVTWYSETGADWQRIGQGDDVMLDGAAADNARFVVYGRSVLHGSPAADGVILTSSDGISWSPVTGRFDGAYTTDGYQEIEAVEFLAGIGWFAVGSDHPSFTTVGAGAVWFSTDGSAWERVVHDDVFGVITEAGYNTITGIAASGGDVLAVGFEGVAVQDANSTRCCDLSAAVWIRKG